MLETYFSSQIRIKLLLKFFLNNKAISYIIGLENAMDDSRNIVKIEITLIRFFNHKYLNSDINKIQKQLSRKLEYDIIYPDHLRQQKSLNSEALCLHSNF